MSDSLPVTPEELIQQGVDAAAAGASILHVHVRDPETGEPTSDLELFRRVTEGLKDETDAIIQPTTGGGSNQSIAERFAVLEALEPEMASCNMGSMNFGMHHLIETVDEFEYEWELEYLRQSRDYIFSNSFETINAGLELFDRYGTVPELECYDTGHLYTVKHLLDRGRLDPPVHIQFVMGILGGIGNHEHDLTHMIETTERLFGDDASWSVIGAGQKEFPFGAHAASIGANVRVGLEDNLYLSRGRLAESNAELVAKMADLAWDVAGRTPATPDEVRSFLGLKGRDAVNF